MAFSSLTYEVADRIGLLTFTTPDLLNSLTEARFADLEAALDIIEQDADLGALVITGTGKGFCVGLDLDLLDRAFDDIAYFESTVRRLAAIIARIEALEIPTIAAVNGFARAGGFEMTLGCDFMIIADEARIGDVHTDAGVVPACVSLRLKRRVGEQRAKEVLWTARWYKGPEAVAIGLALKSVPLASLVDEARAFAATMTDKPRPALASLKRIFIDGAQLGVTEGAELELASFVDYMGNQPYGREGYRAFREKREPDWKPRR
ncbi:enoyl-CoA hydratase/isomerase family protein [Novosphingobium sp. BL-52-GroH]|uniref:enoyl-CoA hydratase/isomerase family protein n=1 Tax=Novosphingobium sp. BL-52-GroH TaxID=3349877 RepID=UPI00384EB560